MAAVPDGGLHAGGSDRCRCTHVAVSVRLSSGVRRCCRRARRAIARSTGMQERGQREAGRCVAAGKCASGALHHVAVRRTATIWKERSVEFAAIAPQRSA
ncbi:hypothetical protein A8D95_38995 [Burkholderia cenocepacia]|uniref:Uncharacterized protein n=1 Tax=Burkholderia cenocepacia TaxID=95486 RepID=A0A1V2WCK2_9BURK|nr:hypothetical protein A8D61_03130 [Burkholderia cenocepacia]ONI99999.1 hypothetical protein A8D83_32715 [Burkholderia cenocepacia]ONJ17884.1 hypothetical protein A8D82_31665 [Burkholderia cenocepacia]ONJ22581.1 hypothetical protein A8D90_27580 [Burkholderia cenocepacia]ONN88498.1 hypothetical protein A8D64_13695 [Burkholderia cenocepacia]